MTATYLQSLGRALTLTLVLSGCANSPSWLGGVDKPAATSASLKSRGETGRAQLQADKVDDAIENLLAAAPENDWRVLTALGAAYDRKGNHAQAAVWHRRADVAAPDTPIVLNNWALSLAQAGQLAEARRMIRRAAALPGAPAQVQANVKLLEAAPGIIVPPQ